MSVDLSRKKLALLLGGGGARGAYEAGVIHYIRTQLPRSIGMKRAFDIISGSSVGAVNACFIAATNHNLEYQGKKMYELWRGINQSEVYRRKAGGLARFLFRTSAGILGNMFGLNKPRGETKQIDRPVHFTGLFDTNPLPAYLKNTIPWKQIPINVQNGSPMAVCLPTTNVHTGKLELFIEKHPSISYTGWQKAHFVNLEVRHAMASSAIPILFPAIRIDKHFYCDGSLRLNAPLSPPVHLGADKILVIGLHHSTERADQRVSKKEEETFSISPTMGEVIGKVFNSIFLDRIQYDMEQMRRINDIIQEATEVYGSDFIDRVNQKVVEKYQTENRVVHQFKPLDVLSIFPSVDIRTIFAECLTDPKTVRRNLSAFEKFIFKLLDVDIDRGHEFLSFILFIPKYLERLLELGFEDARKQHDKLIGFFEA